MMVACAHLIGERNDGLRAGRAPPDWSVDKVTMAARETEKRRGGRRSNGFVRTRAQFWAANLVVSWADPQAGARAGASGTALNLPDFPAPSPPVLRRGRGGRPSPGGAGPAISRRP
jgi:hypothetical protein